jgi:hypothetical protein
MRRISYNDEVGGAGLPRTDQVVAADRATDGSKKSSPKESFMYGTTTDINIYD